MKTVNSLILAIRKEKVTLSEINKKQTWAKALITVLLTSLIAGTLISVNFASQNTANAAPPVPVPNASVSASGNGSGSATSNSQGFYNITSFLDSGNYSVTGSAQGYVDSTLNNVAVTAGAETTNVNIMLTVSGIITGRVTDATTSTGIPNAVVSAITSLSTGQISTTTISDSSGNYRLDTNIQQAPTT
jgi:hypothetical protein